LSVRRELSALAPVAGNDLRHSNINGASRRFDFEEQANSLRSCFACSGRRMPAHRAARHAHLIFFAIFLRSSRNACFASPRRDAISISKL
jgi:hypothetical protein